SWKSGVETRPELPAGNIFEYHPLNSVALAKHLRGSFLEYLARQFSGWNHCNLQVRIERAHGENEVAVSRTDIQHARRLTVYHSRRGCSGAAQKVQWNRKPRYKPCGRESGHDPMRGRLPPKPAAPIVEPGRYYDDYSGKHKKQISRRYRT